MITDLILAAYTLCVSGCIVIAHPSHPHFTHCNDLLPIGIKLQTNVAESVAIVSRIPCAQITILNLPSIQLHLV